MPGRARPRPVRLAATLAGTALATLALFALSDRDGASRAVPPGAHGSARTPAPHRALPVRAVVSLALDATPQPVPRSFFGLSTEYWALPQFEQRPALLERVLALVHARTNGPLLLRIGGDSADHSFWNPQARRMPDWAFALTPAWLARTRALLSETEARVILDLNLVTASPAIAGAWARAALAGLPRGSIAGFEIGNEPDIYSQEFWRAVIAGGRLDHDQPVDLPRSLTPDGYVRDFTAYARVLARAAPGVPLIGPALANPIADRAWLSELLRRRHASLSLVSVHRYPYTACALRGSRAFPTVGRVLSVGGSIEMAAALRPLVAIAHRYGLALRLTELNSIACGGRPGVSDSFATALWATDALFALLRAGADGVNLHVRAEAVNAPFGFDPHGLVARPLLYGLIMFVRALGAGSRLAPVELRAGGATALDAWATRPARGGLNVLLVDRGPTPVRVRLAIPPHGPLHVQRLLAPGPGAQGGVTLAGQSLSRSGRWLGRSREQAVPGGPHGYVLTVGRYSAVLASRR